MKIYAHRINAGQLVDFPCLGILLADSVPALPAGWGLPYFAVDFPAIWAFFKSL